MFSHAFGAERAIFVGHLHNDRHNLWHITEPRDLETSRLLPDLGGGHADGTWESRLRQYISPDLLLLDAFAMKEFGLQQAEDI